MKIAASDLERSIAFYEALTGIKVSSKDETGGSRMAKTQGLDDTLGTAVAYFRDPDGTILKSLLRKVHSNGKRVSCKPDRLRLKC